MTPVLILLFSMFVVVLSVHFFKITKKKIASTTNAPKKLKLCFEEEEEEKAISHEQEEQEEKMNTKKRMNEGEDLTQKDYDIIICGAGIVGSTLASTFARDGRRVLCLEMSLKEPDRIVGELLQPGGVRKLRALGMEECLEGIDSAPIYGYGVFMNEEQLSMQYPHDKEEERPIGRSFHHGRFVMKLREHAMRQKLCTMTEARVLNLIEEDGVIRGVEYEQDGVIKNARAPLTIVATGVGSSSFMKKLGGQTKSKHVSDFVGIELENAATHLVYPNHGHVMMSQNGPVLCYPISSTSVRCLIDFPVGKIPNIRNGDMQAYLQEHTAQYFPHPLKEKFMQCIQDLDPKKIKAVPCHEKAAEITSKRGAILLGDAFNCRHPLTGGGMTVALNDCLLLVRSLQSVKDLHVYHQIDDAMTRFYKERKNVSSTINILANALYAIFAARHDPVVPLMKKAVFQYFKMGGICANGPIALLGGLIESPYILVMHFFSVAFCFCIRSASILQSFQLLRSATNLIAPLIVDENILRYLFPPLLFSQKK